MTAPADACSFAPRCDSVLEECRRRAPQLVTDEGGSLRCLHPTPPTPQPQLLQLVPSLDRTPAPPLLEVLGLSVRYGRGTGATMAVDDVSFTLQPGQTLGVVGLSGSGKSTLLRAVAGLLRPTSGSVLFDNKELLPDAAGRPAHLRREIQLVFQDPGSSLNPRHSVEQLITRPLQLFHSRLDARDRRKRVGELLEMVRLPQTLAGRFPWELSGGQQQRVAIARAFATDPALLLCDEVTSALDVSVQAGVLTLLRELASERRTAIVFVSHDLAVVRSIADRAMVMRNGQVVEQGAVERIFEHAEHPYTAELLAAIPEPQLA